jgi:hypothetical protein
LHCHFGRIAADPGQVPPQGTNTDLPEFIAMKTLSALTLFALVTLSGPALAETPVKATPADACPLAGPAAGLSKDCEALRSVYRVEISGCMDQLRADADARAGRKTDVNSHISRSRFLICDSGVREKMALKVN